MKVEPDPTRGPVAMQKIVLHDPAMHLHALACGLKRGRKAWPYSRKGGCCLLTKKRMAGGGRGGGLLSQEQKMLLSPCGYPTQLHRVVCLEFPLCIATVLLYCF
jgi:hypothetical protein